MRMATGPGILERPLSYRIICRSDRHRNRAKVLCEAPRDRRASTRSVGVMVNSFHCEAPQGATCWRRGFVGYVTPAGRETPATQLRGGRMWSVDLGAFADDTLSQDFLHTRAMVLRLEYHKTILTCANVVP